MKKEILMGIMVLGIASFTLTACARKKEKITPPPAQPMYTQQAATYPGQAFPSYAPRQKQMQYVRK